MAATFTAMTQQHGALDQQIQKSWYVLDKIEKHKAKKQLAVQNLDAQFQDAIEKLESSSADFEKDMAAVNAQTVAPRMPAPSQQLPPGWEVRVNSTTGHDYYVDHNTETTHWELPPAATEEPISPAGPPAAAPAEPATTVTPTTGTQPVAPATTVTP